jgi:uncharacterized protein (DUF362 family)
MTTWSQDRREFLRLAGATVVGAGIAPRLAGTDDTVPEAATVGIANNPSVAIALREAVELAGGLDFIKPGQRVLLKPNQVSPQWHPVTTNPEVLHEAIKLVADAGCEDIFVSDQPVGYFRDGEVVMKTSRHWEASKDAESDIGGGVVVTPVTFDQAEPYLRTGTIAWRRIHHPKAEHFITADGTHHGFRMAELLFQVDHVINLPCCKTHVQTWFTLTLKNFVGMVSVDTRFFFHESTPQGGSPGRSADTPEERAARAVRVSKRIAELNLGVVPSLNIIDATRPLVSGSQVSGDSVQANTIIASSDRIAADVTGIGLLRSLGDEKRIHSMSPWDHPMIRRAVEIGIGVGSRDRITVKHSGVDDIDTILGHMA